MIQKTYTVYPGWISSELLSDKDLAGTPIFVLLNGIEKEFAKNIIKKSNP